MPVAMTGTPSPIKNAPQDEQVAEGAESEETRAMRMPVLSPKTTGRSNSKSTVRSASPERFIDEAMLDFELEQNRRRKIEHERKQSARLHAEAEHGRAEKKKRAAFLRQMEADAAARKATEEAKEKKKRTDAAARLREQARQVQRASTALEPRTVTTLTAQDPSHPVVAP